MKKYFLFFIILSIETATAEKLWIYFTDKDLAADNFITLDDKTLQRRQKMGLGLTWYDRPVNSAYIKSLEGYGAVIYQKSRWLNAVSISSDINIINEEFDILKPNNAIGEGRSPFPRIEEK